MHVVLRKPSLEKNTARSGYLYLRAEEKKLPETAIIILFLIYPAALKYFPLQAKQKSSIFGLLMMSCLPKVYVDHFSVYSVASKDTLIRSTYSILEPDPLCSPKAELAEMDIILVPGLCFDQHRHRIGYGKGHYDRMLHLLRETEHKAKIWGVGFKEQLLDEPFQAEPHDQPLDHVLLF